MILALDIATHVGFASGRPGDEPQWGVRDFTKNAATGGNGEVVAVFRHWLNQRCYDLKPRLIAFESPYIPIPRQSRFSRAGLAVGGADLGPNVLKTDGPPPMNPIVLRRLLAMVGVVEATAFELRIPCQEETSSRFIKFFTGRGSWPGGRVAKKAETIRVCQLHGWDVTDDNAADAIALWCFAEDLISPRSSDQRRRQRADRQRQEAGEGPLFRNENAPRDASRGAPQNPPDESESSNGKRSENTYSGEKNQPFSGAIRRKIA